MLNYIYGILNNNWYLSSWLTIEFFILEILILYVFSLLFFEKNIFFILLYISVLFLIIGFLLCLYQIEVMSAFFWLSELTIIFIFIITIISLTFNAFFKKVFFFISNFYTQAYLYLLYFLTLFFFNIPEYKQLFLTQSTSIYFNFYESLLNFLKTDTYSLFVSFYTINIFEFVSLIFIILLVSIIIVQLSLILYHSNFEKIPSIKLANNFINFFLRQQNLIKQSLKKNNYKSFNKK